MKLFSPARLALVASIALAACAPMFLRSQAQDAPAYRNPKLPIEQRLADLLLRMTNSVDLIGIALTVAER